MSLEKNVGLSEANAINLLSRQSVLRVPAMHALFSHISLQEIQGANSNLEVTWSSGHLLARHRALEGFTDSSTPAAKRMLSRPPRLYGIRTPALCLPRCRYLTMIWYGSTVRPR